jgi:hypothetical protein
MPKSVAPPTPKPKRAETASKRTFRNPRNSEEERRKAIALLNDWSDAHVPVELMPGSSGLRIMGYLVKLQMNPAGDDFMFKTPFEEKQGKAGRGKAGREKQDRRSNP